MEREQRQRVIRALRPLDAISVENRVYPGTPDVNYIGGWIELKWLRVWPKLGGVVKIDHFTQQQRVWLKRRWLRGGDAWLLLQVAKEWLLFDGLTASDIVGNVSKEILEKEAVRWWASGLIDADLRQFLVSTSPRESVYS